jgi:hypothetical protein
LSLLIYDKSDKELPGFIETLLKQYPGDTTLAGKPGMPFTLNIRRNQLLNLNYC